MRDAEGATERGRNGKVISMNDNENGPVVVGVDGSDSSRTALKAAARQASLTKVPLDVVATWVWPTNYGYSMSFAGDYDPEVDAKKVLDEMVALIRETYPDVEIRPHVVHGEAREVLVDRSRSASMLVLGSRGHGELTGMLLGSVSNYCVTHAHCPTLVVRCS